MLDSFSKFNILWSAAIGSPNVPTSARHRTHAATSAALAFCVYKSDRHVLGSLVGAKIRSFHSGKRRRSYSCGAASRRDEIPRQCEIGPFVRVRISGSTVRVHAQENVDDFDLRHRGYRPRKRPSLKLPLQSRTRHPLPTLRSHSRASSWLTRVLRRRTSPQKKREDVTRCCWLTFTRPPIESITSRVHQEEEGAREEILVDFAEKGSWRTSCGASGETEFIGKVEVLEAFFVLQSLPLELAICTVKATAESARGS